jgi:hypothetical protein
LEEGISMLLRFGIALIAAGVVTWVPVLAEEVKLPPLSDFQWKPAFEGGQELGGYDPAEQRFNFYTNGSAVAEIDIPEAGEYTITIEASCTEAEKELARFRIRCGETEVVKEHTCTAEERKKYSFTARLAAGKQKLEITFLNDAYKENEYDRNFFLHAVKVEKE